MIDSDSTGTFGGPRVLTRVVTAEEILEIGTTPLILLEGQAATIWQPCQMMVVYRKGTIDFDGTGLEVGYPNSSFYSPVPYEEGADSIQWFSGPSLSASSPLSSVEGASLHITGTDSSVGDGTLTITLWYYEIPV